MDNAYKWPLDRVTYDHEDDAYGVPGYGGIGEPLWYARKGLYNLLVNTEGFTGLEADRYLDRVKQRGEAEAKLDLADMATEVAEDTHRVMGHTFTVVVRTGGDFAVTRDRVLKMLDQLKGFDSVEVEPARDPAVNVLHADKLVKVLDSLVDDVTELRDHIHDAVRQES